MLSNTQEIWDLVNENQDTFVKLSDDVWDVPELNFHEYRSVQLHERALAEAGFRITHNVAGIPTAIMGEAGEGGPVIAILGEYDALPGLSQKAGAVCHEPLPGNGNGHGCGHNLLGSGALLAATAVKDWLEKSGQKGRIRYYGCPAEEGGAGKTFMVRAGVFDDVDIAISWHPAFFAAVFPPFSLANVRMNFTFSGRSAHAAAAPFLGRSALDAVELMNVGVNYMREHMLPSSRIHYAYQDTGGTAPNVVQSRATIQYSIRATNLAEVQDMTRRVKNIAQGAALMTETTVSSEIISGMANLLGNEPLERTMQACLERLGPPVFDEADREFARSIQKTFTEQEIRTGFYIAGREEIDMNRPLCDEVLPYGALRKEGMFGSTDVGDVSWVVPTVQALGATCALGTPFHSWQLTAQGKSPLAHKGMIHVSKMMADTAVSLLKDPELIQQAKQAHQAKLRQHGPYACPIPADIAPPVKAA